MQCSARETDYINPFLSYTSHKKFTTRKKAHVGMETRWANTAVMHAYFKHTIYRYNGIRLQTVPYIETVIVV